MSAEASPGGLPRHIAIIMDGNGRWAQSRGLPRIAGHRRGAEAVRRTLSEALTRDNRAINLTIALSYGGRAEIAAAARAIAAKARSGALPLDAIDEELIASHLLTVDLPDPDLLIRTSGEQRISNFLLWQCAYAELVFTKTLWPDFGRADLEQAIADYCGRERRYGTSVGSR
jgi:undecaprenyl diphosphate synthase